MLPTRCVRVSICHFPSMFRVRLRIPPSGCQPVSRRHGRCSTCRPDRKHQEPAGDIAGATADPLDATRESIWPSRVLSWCPSVPSLSLSLRFRSCPVATLFCSQSEHTTTREQRRSERRESDEPERTNTSGNIDDNQDDDTRRTSQRTRCPCPPLVCAGDVQLARPRASSSRPLKFHCNNDERTSAQTPTR